MCLWIAEHGLREFLIFSPKVNFYAQPVLVRAVKKRRRRIKVQIDDEGYLESEEFMEWNVSGQSGKCVDCGSSYKVSSFVENSIPG